jgi:hypothetical protein
VKYAISLLSKLCLVAVFRFSTEWLFHEASVFLSLYLWTKSLPFPWLAFLLFICFYLKLISKEGSLMLFLESCDVVDFCLQILNCAVTFQVWVEKQSSRYRSLHPRGLRGCFGLLDTGIVGSNSTRSTNIRLSVLCFPVYTEALQWFKVPSTLLSRSHTKCRKNGFGTS